MHMPDSDYVLTCNTEISSISNNLKKLWIWSDFHSYYIQTIYNDRNKIINNIFSTYVEPLLYDINHLALLQE